MSGIEYPSSRDGLASNHDSPQCSEILSAVTQALCTVGHGVTSVLERRIWRDLRTSWTVDCFWLLVAIIEGQNYRKRLEW